jgi:hypothetical protein
MAVARPAAADHRDDVARLIRDAQSEMADYRGLMDRELDKTRVDETRPEDRIFDQIRELDGSLNRLENRFKDQKDWRQTRRDAERVRQEAMDIRRIYQQRQMTQKMRTAWKELRYDLNRVFDKYGIPRV